MATNSEIPVINLALFEYRKDKKTLQIASEYCGMPAEFFVKSRTGRVVHFVVDQDDMMEHEF